MTTAKLAWVAVGGIAIATYTAIGAGCSGKVEVDGPEPNPSGTTTGMGGATTGTSSTSSNAGGAPGTTTVGTTSDMVASTGDAPPPDGPSVGSGPTTCDFSGNCLTA